MSPRAVDTDVVVVGAGVIGLAVAAELARAGREVVVIERNDGIAREVTSRSSEVVHAGIYYPPGSLKAELCRRGREDLYARCDAFAVPFRKVGKLIVAVEDGELPALERLRANAAENAVVLDWLDRAGVAKLEPDIAACAALLSPETGIVDAHRYAMSFLTEAIQHGAVLSLRTELVALESASRGFTVVARSAEPLPGGGPPERITCTAVVNAAGLGGDHVAAAAGLDVDALGYRLRPCKGDYFALAPGAPLALSHLVYPLPGEAGLGVHATIDLGGRVRFGPDAQFVEGRGEPGSGSRTDLDVDPAKAATFARIAGRYLPTLEAAWLTPDYAGIRPKRAGPGEGFSDFVVREESDRGLPGLVNCIGIESPGLTAASAIGRRVGELLW
jgi:L-2-hydroxyglutarate oxidase LhgO